MEARWREQEIATRLDTKATEILDKLKAGATLAEIAAADHLKVESLTDLKRGAASGPLSATAVDAVFRTAKDAAGKAEAAQPAEQVVFRVTDITVPNLDVGCRRHQTHGRDAQSRRSSEDILGEYIARLESETGRDDQSRRAEPGGRRRGRRIGAN